MAAFLLETRPTAVTVDVGYLEKCERMLVASAAVADASFGFRLASLCSHDVFTTF